MTSKEYREAARKKRNGKSKPKYNNKKITVLGIEFDSKAEGRRYSELLLLIKAGQITELELQPEYILQPSFRYEGKAYRSIKYTPDFRYMKDGKVVVEEVKGFADTSYKIRKRLFLFQNPDLSFYELNL